MSAWALPQAVAAARPADWCSYLHLPLEQGHGRLSQ